MKITLAAACCALFFSASTLAINVGAITEIIPPDKKVLAKEVTNTVDEARLVSLGVTRISSPMENGTIIPMESEKEIMITPANLILPGRGKDVFRLFYSGPQDDKERYYRLVWRDDPVAELGNSKSHKMATATTSATISTIMVVSPRKENFSYRYDNGVVYNTGNATFRVVAAGPCLSAKKEDKKKGCRERYYVMPGLGVHLKFIDFKHKKSSIGVWHNQDYLTVQ